MIALFKAPSPQRRPNSSPIHEGAAPPPSTRGGGGVLLRPREDWERPRRAEGGSPQGADSEVAVGDGWRCEGGVSAEMCWGDVMTRRCAAEPPGSWVWSGPDVNTARFVLKLIHPLLAQMFYETHQSRDTHALLLRCVPNTLSVPVLDRNGPAAQRCRAVVSRPRSR
jgi:hypothetical protein